VRLFLAIPTALAIGLVAGAVCYSAVTRLKRRFAYDDSLDVFGVRGLGGSVGILMLGFLAPARVTPPIATCTIGGQACSLVGGLPQFLNQRKGVAFTMVFAGGATFVLLKIVDRVVGLRVAEEDETSGIGLSQHGESAYNG
jgi:ammonium transporter, Amt family